MTSPSEALASYISTLSETYDATTEQKAQIRQVFSGIEVRQRAVSSTPDVLNCLDTIYIDVLVKASGIGERGLETAWIVADAVYKKLQLILDLELDGIHFTRISADSAPFEVGSTMSPDSRWVQFGLECVRFLDGVKFRI